jgi:DNA-binding GntR family transcriptional regulator
MADALPERVVFDVPSLPEVISDQLRTDITRGVYKPGPVRIGALAERFGVSPMPVREALRRLEAEGLISFQRNRQIIINALSVDEVDEVFQLRAELEPYALRRAVPKLQRNAEALRALDDLVVRMDAAIGDPDAWRTMNLEFHAKLYRGAGMPRLDAIIGSLWASIESYIRFYLQIAADVKLAQQQHKELLALVGKGDAEAAAAVLTAHIALSRDGLINAMLTRPDDSPAAEDRVGA